MDWDEETEITYREVHFKRGAVFALLLILILGISAFAGLDGIRPKYRGDKLTIQEFSDNYNAYLEIFAEDHQHYEELKQDGTWKPIPQNTAVMDFNDDRSNHRMEFEYELEGEKIKTVSIHHDWNSVKYLSPLDDAPLNLACSILLAQKDCGIKELLEFRKVYEDHIDQMNESFVYGNLLIEWNIESEKEMLDGIIYADGQEDVTATLIFRITIR